MAFSPVAPTVRIAPEQVAPDTYLIHQLQHALGAPLSVYINSLVIVGAEPVIVDTGTIANREQWLADAFTLVDPDDVKWVFISHDDVDHTGNLSEVMEACPNATLVASWAMVERHANAFEFPLARTRWINDGDSFDAGDRELRAMRPPFWDSPTTRGLFDTSTGVYWAVDAFATPMPTTPVATVGELDPIMWRDGAVMFAHHAVAPWLAMVDPAKYAAHIDRIQVAGARTIVTAHSPVIPESHVAAAFDLMRDLPSVTPPEAPDQSVLDAVLGTVSA
jgi:flavorubredoxin